ncbi:hypothetical protein O6H91_Y561300 [Diphasiastrum complanatum]|nr:hypothetical protein O6H91_Y561300 [Diphasiastrum complanatum]
MAFNGPSRAPLHNRFKLTPCSHFYRFKHSIPLDRHPSRKYCYLIAHQKVLHRTQNVGRLEHVLRKMSKIGTTRTRQNSLMSSLMRAYIMIVLLALLTFGAPLREWDISKNNPVECPHVVR